MKFITVLIGAVALIGNVHAASSVTTAVPPAATGLVKCLEDCDPADNDCRAHCVAVPSPNQQQVNATIECVAGCDQGKGSASDIQNYINCRDDCIAQNYFTTDGTPGATGTSGSKASGTGTSANPTGTSGSDSDSPSGTSGSSSPSDTPGAASSLVMTSTLGLFAVLAAVFAL